MNNAHTVKRKTVKIILAMLAIMLLTAAISYSIVTIPYTFTGGGTIRSTEMNYNFLYLGNRMGAMRYQEFSGGVITATGSPYQSLGSISFTAPASGYVSLRANVYYANNSRTSSTGYNWAYFGIGTNTTSTLNYSLFQTPSGTPTGDTAQNFTCDAYQQVTGGSNYTYHLLAWRDGNGTNSWYIIGPTLTIQFFPSLL